MLQACKNAYHPEGSEGARFMRCPFEHKTWTTRQETFAFHIRSGSVFQQLRLVRKEEIEASNSFDDAEWTCFRRMFSMASGGLSWLECNWVSSTRQKSKTKKTQSGYTHKKRASNLWPVAKFARGALNPCFSKPTSVRINI